MRVPASLLSPTGLISRVETHNGSQIDALGNVITGQTRASFDSEGKIVKMEISRNVFEYFSLSTGDYLGYNGDGGTPSLENSCSCEKRRKYWFAETAKGCGYTTLCLSLALQERDIAESWDYWWGWISCSQPNIPGGC